MATHKKQPRNLLVVILTLIVSIIFAEVGLRVLYKDQLSVHTDERNLTYRYDPILGWFPLENSKLSFTGSRTISVNHNSRGFRDVEPAVGDKPGIIFLGDSFVWGYDAEQSERFTDLLQMRLPGWSIYNFGVSGYGTDQEYLLLKQNFDYYKPDIVFLVFSSVNDEVDNSSNSRYSGYYKPYLVKNQGSYEVRGIPVPKSENYFLTKHKTLSKSYLFRLATKTYFRLMNPAVIHNDNPTAAIIVNMNKYVNSKGAQFLVGIQGKRPGIEDFLSQYNIPYVNLANDYIYPSHGGHWTPEGHVFVSNKIYSFLTQGNYLKKNTPRNGMTIKVN